MKLTYQTDYALRLLMFLAIQGQRRSSIREVATHYGVSENHLMKVTQRLAGLGYVDALRGRGGGLMLAQPPSAISVGAVVKAVEPDFAIVECFAPKNTCPITPVCALRHVLDEALAAFFNVLDAYTLHDLVTQPDALRNALDLVVIAN